MGWRSPPPRLQLHTAHPGALGMWEAALSWLHPLALELVHTLIHRLWYLKMLKSKQVQRGGASYGSA